jgi:endonuclease/exonuclease/phosphatase (EEP) superfamily protein YafD
MDRSPTRAIARPLAFATAALSLATLLAYGGRWSWFCDLLVNFRTHYALLLAVTGALAAAFRHWRIAGAALIGVALNAWPMVGAVIGAGPPPAADGRPVRVVAFNVNVANADLPAIAKYLRSLDADVVILEELPAENVATVGDLLPSLPHRHLADNQDIWGVVILSRWPLIAPQRATRDGIAFAARADVDLGDRVLRVYGAHLNWPVVPESARIRDAQLAVMGRELAACPHACVVAGDFNVTPWSSHYRDVLAVAGVRDCAAGFGLLPTWSSSLPMPVRIRIDQCVVAGAVSVADVRVGHSVGSDHFATINDLRIGAVAAARVTARRGQE